jgi:hypothetical protein
LPALLDQSKNRRKYIFLEIVLKNKNNFKMASEPVFYNVEEWIEENKKFFLPPVCNKMMHNCQLKVSPKLT